jgi:hypothetical protein
LRRTPGLCGRASTDLQASTDQFPFQTNWRTDACHFAFWELVPTLDHILPVSRGGTDDESNWATTSMLRNSAKANFTLDELGWSLCSPGDPANTGALTVQPTATLTLVGTGPNGNPESATATATATDQVISTRRGNALPAWLPMIGMNVAGTWTLDLSNPDMRGLFQPGQVQDILFVITYGGQTPAWPA